MALIRSDALNVNDQVDAFSASLIDAAMQTIPKTGPSSRRVDKPWYNEACNLAIKNRRKVLHRLEVQPDSSNLQAYRILRAEARIIIRLSKRSSWQAYVSNLNSQTPSKKVWDMIKRLNGKSRKRAGNNIRTST